VKSPLFRYVFVGLFCGACFALSIAQIGTGVAHAEEADASRADLASARALFEANLQSIRDRDTKAYLASYLNSENLARNGPGGIALGYDSLAAGAGSGWPDVFDATDLELVWLRPGVVYGSYRYRVAYGSVEQTGRSERVFVATDEGWKIAVTTAFATPEAPPPPTALVGATLIDGQGGSPIIDSVIVVREGEVECAGNATSCEIPSGAETIELAGRWITPGLIDAHVHFSQTGWADGRPDFLDLRETYPYPEVAVATRKSAAEYSRSFLCSGITAVFDVGGYPWTWGLREPAETDTLSPHVAAAGPLLSTIPFWLNLPAEAQFLHLADPETAREQVRYFASQGSDAVKIWYIAEEPGDVERYAPAVRAAGEEAEALGLRLIVHATGLAEAKVAVEAGASLLVHSVWEEPIDDSFIAALLEQGTTYCPTLTVTLGYERLADAVRLERVPEIDDPNGCVDLETRRRVESSARVGPGYFETRASNERLGWIVEQERTAAESLKRLADAGVPIAVGTDSGNPLTLHGPAIYAELEAMQAAGLSAEEVLLAATRGSAGAMGRAGELGAIAAGRPADLLVLSADPLVDIANMRRLEFVMRGGELRSVEELSASETVTEP